MANNKLLIPYTTGITAYDSPPDTHMVTNLSVVLYNEAGSAVAGALSVVKSTDDPTLYIATVPGTVAAGNYGAIVYYKKGTADELKPFYNLSFRWNGTDIVEEFEPALDSVTASNMRGTDDALLAANYTAPDDTAVLAAIAALQNLSPAQVELAVAAALGDYDVATAGSVAAGAFGTSDRAKLTETWQRQNLDPSHPVVRSKSGDNVVETFDGKTITHASNGEDSVTSTRS